MSFNRYYPYTCSGKICWRGEWIMLLYNSALSPKNIKIISLLSPLFSCFTYLNCEGKCSFLYWLGNRSVPVVFLKGSFPIPWESMAKLLPAVGRVRLDWRLGLSALVNECKQYFRSSFTTHADHRVMSHGAPKSQNGGKLIFMSTQPRGEICNPIWQFWIKSFTHCLFHIYW